MTIDLRWKHILITGASSGIGAATAVAAARAGATVGLCARRPDRLQETADRCEAASPDGDGGSVHHWVVDLADLDTISAFAADVLRVLGKVDILVNNAGAGRRTRMQHISVEAFDATMDLNFSAPMRLTLALLPHMLERNSGHIVNVGSSGTREFAPSTGSYIAAKAALDAFTEALYIDLAPTDVHPHLVVPGRTATEFGQERPGQEPAFPIDPTAIDTPETVAAAILGCLGTDDFETYPNDAVRDACQAKRLDFNGYLRTRRGWFTNRS